MNNIKKIIVFLSTIVLSVNCFAQTDTTNKREESGDSIYTVVQIAAYFPGGIEGWREYLTKNLNGKLGRKIPIDKGQLSAKQTVILSFIVDKEGNVSNIKCDNSDEVLPQLVQEAIRIMKKGPKWVPAVQNGIRVINRMRQGITWQVSKE